MQTINVTPQNVATGAPAGAQSISPEAHDIVTRIREHYRTQGKAAAAQNYGRHLKAFFSWAEAQGYSIRGLPADAVESFLSALAASGQKETTLYVLRTQLKAALREVGDLYGLDVGHLEFVSGKPVAVKQKEREKDKERRRQAKAQTNAAQAAAIHAAQTVLGMQAAPTQTPPEEYPMSEPTAPQSSGSAVNGASAPAGAAPAGPQVIVVQQPAGANPNGGRGTLANPNTNPARAPNPSPAQPARGVLINNHTFTGAFIKISYMSDGSNPFNPPGTETYLTTMPASQLAPHGDLGGFLQQYVVPTMRLAPTTSQIAFVFHELNDRRQPTGRRDELVIGIPLAAGSTPAQSAPGLAGFPAFGAPPAAPQDSATTYLLKKLDEEAADAKRRAEEYQAQMKEAKDAQSVFMLTQAFQREQDLRKELEERRSAELARASAPPPMPLMPPMPFMPPPPPIEVKPDTSATDMVKALADNQSRMMEVMVAAMKPQPPPPVKDTAEWLVPFISQMNQQAQAQAQANQQLLISIMQSNQQFMQAMIQKESPVEKMLFAQLQEVKAAANAPKEDELESFIEKYQKVKMMGDMMGGGTSTLLTDLLANMDTIGAGAAKIIDAAKGNSHALAGAPTAAVRQEQRQLTGAPAPQALPQAAATSEREFPPPSEEVKRAFAALSQAVNKEDDEATVAAFLTYLREIVTAQEPYASMGRRLMAAFQTSEDEGELYTLAKNVWIVVGEKPMRPPAKYLARVLAEYYSALHQAIFNAPRTLPEDAELDASEGAQGAGAADAPEAVDAEAAEDAEGAEAAQPGAA